ncbi:hypothetical protein [Halobacillus seohaensis]|uniref:Uncharacterized protein n=1 Tax=Halobacillus seohaensis TaxID=447421 RepID=A0ABW2EHE1_9BACI
MKPHEAFDQAVDEGINQTDRNRFYVTFIGMLTSHIVRRKARARVSIF